MEKLSIPFAHEHPLTLLTDSQRLETKLLICYGCGKQVLSSQTSYACELCDDFIIHQKCAELPPEIKHPFHAQHTLTLRPKPPYDVGVYCWCDACGQTMSNFTYHCSSNCIFDLDIFCAFGDTQTLVQSPAAASSEFNNNIIGSHELRHFSHEQHPMTLVFKDDQDQEDLDFFDIITNSEESICSGCSKPVRSSSSSSEPTYGCRECNIFLHKRCADLPTKIEDHPMHSEHPLLLLAKPPYRSGSCRCQVCRKSWSGFVYNCSSCYFDIDILCAFSNSEMIPTHNHPVKLMKRPASFKCNACDVRGFDDQSHQCTLLSCDFWIHKGCASFPQKLEIKDHDHPLSLAISLPIEYRKRKFINCQVCKEELRPSMWLYYCGQCSYFVHFKCVAVPIPPRPSYSTRATATLSFPAYYYIMRKKLRYGGVIKLPEGEVKVESHQHSLLPCNVNTNDEEITCDGCAESISGSDPWNYGYYKCGHGQCSFFLHLTCAKLLKHCPNPGHVGCSQPRLTLHFPHQNHPWEVLECKLCNSFSNGYSYKCHKCDFCIDLKCSFVMGGRIWHDGHNHLMFMDCAPESKPFTCNGCGLSKTGHHFCCPPCKYKLGFECVTLPPRVKHRWDKHELTLTYPPFENIDDFYCEVCEEKIDPTHWVYRCNECDQSFHPRCIPTLGASKNIKFGRTLAIQRHPHPLTHVPEGNLTSRCDDCHKLLYWKRLYECAACKFYICPDCIAN